MHQMFLSLLIRLAAVLTVAAPAHAQPLSDVKLHDELSGPWRMFLPAGFEHQVTLQRAGDNRYELQSQGLNSGGLYEVRGDRLVRIQDEPADHGTFQWHMRSSYMLTLVDQPTNLGSDYSGAVMFRPREIPELQRQATDADSDVEVPWPLRATVEELNAMVQRGEYHLVRKFKVGHQLEAVGVVESIGKSESRRALVDLPGEFWSATLHNVPVSHELEVGDRVKLRALIVDEAYGALVLWVYEYDQLPMRSRTGRSE